MSTSIQAANIPQVPFDGQEFIDAYRIKWIYMSEGGYWYRAGSLPTLPEANTEQRGLLSAQLKTVIDSIPEAGGHFSFIADPKLSTIPFRHTALLKATVLEVAQDNSGSSIKIMEGGSGSEGGMIENAYAGKAVLFTTGLLANRTLFITANDETTLYIQGPDAVQSKVNDKLEIIDTIALNKDGLIFGDIVLTSESLDITFVNGDGEEITDDCKVIQCDTPDKPPGINIRLSDKFINEFCVQVPGCRGARGDRGPKGPDGIDGTGDGPEGEQGDPGNNAITPHTFTGIKIRDITDIFDTAVVGVDLDAAKGKLHVVKARVKTADNSKPADQVIASAVSRDIQFTDNNFGYKILMPNNDPINDSDITVLHYPESFSPKTSSGDNKPENFSIWNLKLSTVIDSIIKSYENKLAEIGNQYDAEIKPYIEQKDKEARTILAQLAGEVAQCEFQLPIDFCLGIEPKVDCNPNEPTVPTTGPAGEVLGDDFRGGNTTILPPVKIPLWDDPPVTIPEPEPDPNTGTPITDTTPETTPNYVATPGTGAPGISILPPRGGNKNNESQRKVAQSIKYTDGSEDLPAGTYMVQWIDGSGRVDNGPYNAGVTVEYTDDTGTSEVSFTEPEEVTQYNWDAKAYSEARKKAPLDKNVVTFTLTTKGRATAKWKMAGSNPTGSVKLQPTRVFKTSETDLPIPLSQTIIRGPVETTGGGSGSGPADCNQAVDCGDFNPEINCPQCPPEIHAISINPNTMPIATPTSITITGSGFVDTVKVFIGGTEMPVISQTNTLLTVIAMMPIADTYDVELNMGSAVAYAPNGIVVTP